MPPPMTSDDGSMSAAARLARIEARQEQVLSAVQQVAAHQRTDYVRHQQLQERVADLETWQTWLMRIVVGAVIAGLLALVIIPVRL